MVVRNVVRSPVRAVVQSVFGEGESFHPFQLFTSGAQGAWYDPSDFSTLYQNATGTTPVTAVEQPVRLMLDRSRGLVLGSELITNGGFDSATGWTLGAGWSISGGQLLYPTGASVTDATQNIITANRFYVMEIDVASLSGSTLIVFVGSSTFVTITTIGVHRFQLFTTGDNRLIIRPNATSTNVAINSISVRELPGNHALAPNDASRPILRARYNLLTYTEQFDNAAWGKNASSVTANAAIAPDGTTTADLIQLGAGTAKKWIGQTVSAISGDRTYTVFAKSNGAQFIQFLNNGTVQGFANFDILNGIVGTTGAGVTASISDAGNGWWRCSVSHSIAAATDFRVYGVDSNTAAWDSTTTATTSYYLWGAQLLTAADQASTGGAYQRVGAATDYDTGPPWRPYLAFDGSDDSMSTSSIDFSGTDEVTVFAGLTKLSDASLAVFAEISAASASNNGTFALFAPNPANLYTWRSRGTTSQDVNTGNPAYNAPDTSVLTGIGDISGDVSTLRIDGAQVGTNTSDQGTGNYGNYPLFIGRRNNASIPFNGRLYGLTVLGRTATAPELTAMESWIAGKTGVSL